MTVLTPPLVAAGDDAVESLPIDQPTSGRAAWHPIVLAVPVAIAFAVAGLVLAGDGNVGATSADGLRFGLVVAWSLAGAVLATRRPLCRLGVTLLAGTLVGAASFAGSTASAAGWEGAGGALAHGAHHIGGLLLPAIGLHVLLSLPRGDLPAGRRPFVLAAYAAFAAAGLVIWLGPHEHPAIVTWTAWVLAVAAGLPGAHAAYLRTAGLERQRLQWVGCGVAMALEAALVIGALDLLIDWPSHGAVAAGWATVLVPASLAASAFPKLAAGLDRVLVHAVSLAGLTATTVAVYLIVVVGLGEVPDDDNRDLLALSMAAAAVAAALYLPARERLADVANRLVYGERHAPDEVLRTFGSRLTRAIPMDELLLQLAESLRKTLSLTRAEVWTGTPELLELTVSVPFADPVKLAIGEKERPVIARAGVSGQAWVSVWLPALLEGRRGAPLRVAPVSHSGELLGLIVVERPADGDAFSEEDDRVLTELARQVGLALHNVQLDSALQATLDEVRHANEELRASRARIVATGDAERRKIERNLHDGAQQHLVALAVNLRLTKDLVTEDPETAGEMLDQLALDVKETIAELRSLAHGIYPPLLVDSGLGEALRAAATRSPLDVGVDVTATERYGSEIEAAIYFCCLEALQNAAKHAPGSSATVRVWDEAGGLLFEVADDGPGFDAEVAMRGHGFTNMSDRLGAIGGSVRWDSALGAGTRISGSVPLDG